MSEPCPAQRYRDWLTARGMVERVNEVQAKRAELAGLPAPTPKPLPPPPPGSLDDLELKRAARSAKAKERRESKKKGAAA